ncbi:MAG: hypothetical protein ACI865_000235 [Flavobacteriaceae bacterium]|jgi:hypothetical protein
MKTEIEVKTGFFPLAWFLYFVSPVVVINGEKNTQKWGRTFFDLPPGEYLIKVYFPYMWKPECGANQITVKLGEGETKRIDYNMPPWMFAKGRLREVS